MLDAWTLEQATFAGTTTRLSRPGTGPRPALQISRIMHHNLGQTISVGWPVQKLGANLRVCLCRLLARNGRPIRVGNWLLRSVAMGHEPPRPPQAGATGLTPLRKVYSITSSAVPSNLSDTVTPSAIAVLRLINNSNLVGA